MIQKIKIVSALLFQLLFYFGYAQNQEIKFKPVTDPNGKSIGKINAMGQDPYGYMWFALQTEKCLYRYDGNRFVSFRHDANNPNSLGVVAIETMFVDDEGMIWIGGRGLDLYNPKTGTFTHYRHEAKNKNSLSDSYIYAILKDHHGRLWIGTENGLDCMDIKTGKFTHFKNEPGNTKSVSSNHIWRLFEDRQGVVWIAGGIQFSPEDPEDGGLNRFNEDGSFTRYLHDPKDPSSLANNRVAAMFEDNRGVFWVGTKFDGLQTMDRKTGRFERVIFNPESKPDCLPPKSAENFNTISFISGDSTGGLWIGMLNSGMLRYEPVTKKTINFERCNGYPDSSSWCGYTTREGEFWVAGANDDKMFRVDPFYKPISKIQTGALANTFLEDMDGSMWIATFGKGLLKYDQHKNLVKQFLPDPKDTSGLPNHNIAGLYQDQKNIIWVGTFGGMRILNTQTNTFIRMPGITPPFKDSAGVGCGIIMKDNQGLLWFPTWGLGLNSFNPNDNTFKQFLHNEDDSTSIASNNLNTLVIDKMGRPWTCGDGGISRLVRETGHFKRYLPKTFITNLFEDSDGNLWAGSENGLFQYNEKEDRFFTYFDPFSDLYSLVVGQITEDQTHQIWLTSSSTIIRLNPSTKETRLYDIKYGIKRESFAFWTKSYMDKQGKLYFGYDSGFYFFSPKDLEVNTKMNIIITDLFVNSLPASDQKIHLEKNIEEISELTLPYNQNNIAFNFSAIDYKAPELTRYSTMLENYDNTWRDAKIEKNAAYYNVQPGHYIFHIKAFNNEGVKAEKLIDIQILPPWWKTWWAYALYGLLFLTAIFLIYKIQKQRIIQKERRKQQAFELAQAKEIEKAYHELRSTQAQLIQSEKMASLGELTAGIAHEIQNPLNFVNNFSDVNTELLDEAEKSIDAGNNVETKQLLQTIKENEEKIKYHGQRADAIVKSMLQHSRTSTGQKEPTDINSLADEYLRLSYHGLRAKDKTFNVTLKTDFDPGIGKINIIPQDIGRVLLNLYNNAFYAVSEKKQLQGSGFEPTVSVSTKKTGNKVLLSVKDNGKGIPKQVRDKIFQPFFTTKPTGQGTGLGLSLSYDIVKSHGGEIIVESFPDNEDGGTIFTIELPVL